MLATQDRNGTMHQFVYLSCSFVLLISLIIPLLSVLEARSEIDMPGVIEVRYSAA